MNWEVRISSRGRKDKVRSRRQVTYAVEAGDRGTAILMATAQHCTAYPGTLIVHIDIWEDPFRELLQR